MLLLRAVAGTLTSRGLSIATTQVPAVGALLPGVSTHAWNGEI